MPQDKNPTFNEALGITDKRWDELGEMVKAFIDNSDDGLGCFYSSQVVQKIANSKTMTVQEKCACSYSLATMLPKIATLVEE